LLIFVTARVINERGEYVKVIDKEDAEAGAAIPPKAGAPAKPVPAKKPAAPAKAALPAAVPANEGK
jgi:hypothetical protein